MALNKEIKDYIADKTALLPLNRSISTTESESRAAEFLSVMARLSDWRHILTEHKIKCLSVQTATYAEELSKGTGKTITENKITAEATKAYTEAREDFEYIENDINYLKTQYDIFNNGHIFYRQLSKENNSL